jgi:DNA-directed RNA polymerase specialized sigma24 family protein
MSSNQNIRNSPDTKTSEPATAPAAPATPAIPEAPASRAAIVSMLTISPEAAATAPGNDNPRRAGVADTTPLVARPDVVRYVRAVLRRYGIAPQDMDDAVADVQADAIEAARAGAMPRTVAQWKALAATIAARWAIDRLREAEVRDRYDAGLCEDPDVYLRPTLHWEQRDPVDTKRYLAILKDLFDSGQMPEHGAEILWGEAEDVPHDEIAAEIGVSRKVVDKRLFRMRALFRARLAALGILPLMLLLLGVLLAPVGDTAAPARDVAAPTGDGPAPAPSTTGTETGAAADAQRDGGAPLDAAACW